MSSKYAHHLTYDWFLPYRAQRVEQLLEARGKHDVSTFKTIQADVTSFAARDMFAMLRDAQPQTEAGRDALARLAAWDFQMKRDAPEPLIYHAWMRELKHRIFADDLGALTEDFVDQAELTSTLLHVLSGRAQARDWCDDRSTEQRFETCRSLAGEALDASVTQLTQASGRDVAGLRWGDVHRAAAEHRPMSSVPVSSPPVRIAHRVPRRYAHDQCRCAVTPRRSPVLYAAYRHLARDIRPRRARIEFRVGGFKRAGRQSFFRPLWIDAAAVARCSVSADASATGARCDDAGTEAATLVRCSPSCSGLTRCMRRLTLHAGCRHHVRLSAHLL